MAAHLHKLKLNLKRGVTQKAGKLGLCHNFGGHKVQQKYLKRADILGHSPFFRHYEYIFAVESLSGGKVIGNFDGHLYGSFRGHYFEL